MPDRRHAEDEVILSEAEVAALSKEARQLTRAVNRRLVPVWIAVVVAALAGVAALLAWRAVETRFDEALQTGCEQSNEDRDAVNHVILPLLTRDGLDQAEAQGRVDAALEFIGSLRPLRICTSEGIDDFNASGGERGVEPVPIPEHVQAFLEEHDPDGNGTSDTSG